jgi:hypothetical protein
MINKYYAKYSKSNNNENENRNEEETDEEEVFNGFNAEEVSNAKKCKNAWKQYWDPKTEQFFYFNRIIGMRQLKKPFVLINSFSSNMNNSNNKNSNSNNDNNNFSSHDNINDDNSNSNNDSNDDNNNDINEKNAEFYLKKKKLIKHLNFHHYSKLMEKNKNRNKLNSFKHSNNIMSSTSTKFSNKINTTTTSAAINNININNINNNNNNINNNNNNINNNINNYNNINIINKENDESIDEFNKKIKKENLSIVLERDAILSNFFENFIKMSKNDFFTKFFKFSFCNEDGIDSGGLSKEAFLLASKEIALFVGFNYFYYIFIFVYYYYYC